MLARIKCWMISILCLAIPLLGQAQDDITFQGSIEDRSTQGPLPFVNISYGTIGVYSNIDGKFKLVIPTGIQSIKDTIRISSVGFKTIMILLDTISSTVSYQIRMEPDVYELDEVVIQGESIKIDAKTIVENAISNLSRNTNTNEYILQAFFKQSHYFVNILSGDRKYIRYLESALLLQHKPDQHYESIIKEVRESNDYRESYTYDHPDEEINRIDQNFNFENEFLALDYSKPYKGSTKEYSYVFDLLDPVVGNLNNNFVYRHKFKLDTITKYDNRLVYVIEVLPSKKSTTTWIKQLKKLFIPIGRLYIAGDDYSILEFQYSYIINPNTKNDVHLKLAKVSIQGIVLFRDIVKYKEHKGKMYLNYLMREQGDTPFMAGFEEFSIGKPNFTEESGHFRIKRELVVNNIVEVDKPMKRSYLQPKYNSFFPESYVYNKEFWDSYNILLNSDEERKLLKDLGEGVPLEQQFIENGRKKK